MKQLLPVGDNFMVEVGSEENPLGLTGGANPDDGIREGRVVAVSDEIKFFGYVTFFFEKSLGDTELLKDLYAHYKKYLGKKVYWPERTESGTIIKHGEKQYAFIKWSSIMAVENEDK